MYLCIVKPIKEVNMEFEIIKSTSTEIEVKFSDTLKLKGKRHHILGGGNYWSTTFYKYGKVQRRDPFGGMYVEECWFIPKGNSINGVRLVKRWSKKGITK